MAQSYSITAILSAVDRGFSSAMDKAAKSTESLGKTVQDKMGGIGKATTIAGAATTAMGVSALKGYGNFQQSLNQAAVIAGGTAKDIDGLAKVANKMGAELPISAQDAANAMVAMARDGASIETIKQRFPAIAKAATAAGADLETTASVVQQSMNIWGKSLKSPEQAAGILVQVANQSNASIESMQQALSSIGPTAASAGYSMQDTANAIGLLTNTGMSSAQAADNLNHAIVQMQSPTKKSRGYMEELGISFRDAEGNMKPIPQVASELSGALKNLGKEQQDAALKAMFGQDGMKVMRTLMKAVGDETDNTATSWNAASKAIEKYAGTTEKANSNLDKQASEMQKNVGSKIEQLGGNWESLSNKSMDSQSKVTGSMLDMANKALEWAGKSNSSTAKVIRGFIGLSPAIGPAMTAVGGFLANAQKIGSALSGGISAVGKLGSGAIGLTKKLFGVVSPANKLNSALDATGGKGAKAKDSLDKVADSSKKVNGPAKASSSSLMAVGTAALKIGVAIGAATAGIAMLVTALNNFNMSGTQVVTILGAIGEGFAIMFVKFTLTLAENMSKIALAFVQMFITIQQTVLAHLPEMIANGIKIILALIEGLTQGIPQIVGKITEMMVAIFGAIGDNAPQIVASFAAMCGQLLAAMVEISPLVLQVLVAALTGMLVAGATFASRFNELGGVLFNALKAGITGKKYDVVGEATKIIQSAGEEASRNGMNAFDKAGGNSAIASLKALGNKKGDHKSKGAELGNAAADGINSKKDSARRAGSSVGSSGAEGVRSKRGEFDSAGSFIGQGLVAGIQAMTGNVMGAASRLASMASNAIRSALKIHSPSRVTKEFGMYFGLGFINGISGMEEKTRRTANSLAEASMFAVPAVDTTDFTRSLTEVNRRLTGSVDNNLTNELSLNQQPAYINVSLGGTDYGAFVEDISREQGSQASLNRNYKF